MRSDGRGWRSEAWSAWSHLAEAPGRSVLGCLLARAEVHVAETKRRWYAPVLTEAEAAQAIKEASSAFFVVAGLMAVFAVVMQQYATFFDVMVMTGCSLCLRLTASRVAAVLLAALVLLQIGVTVGNIAGMTHSGGTNVLLSIFMAVAAWRGVQAAWLLHRARSAAPRNGPATA